MKGVRDAVVFVVVLALQATLLYRIEIAGVRPDLLAAFVVYFAWMRGPVPGTVAGFSVGLVQDLDASGPLGLNALAKTVVGFLVAKAGFRVHRSNIGVRFSFFLIAMLVHDFIYFAVATGGDGLELARQMIVTALPTALYTTVATLILLGVAERFTRRRLLADEE
ncbi:MAG TPA: rod shape-determining protein MreD [Candidatus Eisenbacteria bacterium]|nr:rod shape-determining protein MreD [Candidatus Eisenbacteria bacterium]